MISISVLVVLFASAFFVLFVQRPRTTEDPTLIDYLNVSFVKDNDMKKSMKGALKVSVPAHELPLVPISDLTSWNASSYVSGFSIDVKAGCIRGDSFLSGVAEVILRQLDGVRLKLGKTAPPRIRQHVDPVTDELMISQVPIEKVEALRASVSILDPFVDVLKARVVQHILRCPLERIRCPKYEWYTRIANENTVQVIHSDGGFMTDDQKLGEFFMAYKTSYDGWVTLWVLLSESTYNSPVVTFDPADFHQDWGKNGKLNPWMWPPRDRPESHALSNSTSGSGTDGLKAYTFRDMQRGDMLFWRIGADRKWDVPHGAASGNRPDGKRSSFDIQCVCSGVAKPRVAQMTVHGETCREFWRKAGQVMHGCQNPDADPKGPFKSNGSTQGVQELCVKVMDHDTTIAHQINMCLHDCQSVND